MSTCHSKDFPDWYLFACKLLHLFLKKKWGTVIQLNHTQNSSRGNRSEILLTWQFATKLKATPIINKDEMSIPILSSTAMPVFNAVSNFGVSVLKSSFLVGNMLPFNYCISFLLFASTSDCSGKWQLAIRKWGLAFQPLYIGVASIFARG